MKPCIGLLLVLTLAFCPLARAQFVVDKVEARQVEQSIQVQVHLDLSLTDATEDALSHGVPIIVVHEITLNRGGWLWSRVEQRTSERHRLRYHMLSGRYVVDSDNAVLDTFRSLSDALEYINSAAVRFEVPGQNGEYTVAVRSRIDVNALPAPLRPTALLSPAWQLSSDWTQWPINGLSIN